MRMNQRRRLLMISTHGYVAAEPELGLPDTGGQVVYVLELSKHLGRMGYDVDVFTRRFDDQRELESFGRSARLVRVPCGGTAFIEKERLGYHIPEWSLNALRLIRATRYHYDAVISHYWDAGLAGDTLSAWLGVPHVHVPHSLGAWKRDTTPGDSQALEARYNFSQRISAERRLYRSCHKLIATTAQQGSYLQGRDYRVKAGKVVVIPPGFDPDRFFPVAPAKRNEIRSRLGFTGKTVLAVGRIADNKGYDLLIEAFALLSRDMPAARLVLAIGSTRPSPAESADLSHLRALARGLGVHERIVFTGHVADADLADYYRAADIFALSSRYEPFGMTAIEAMACGTPTVVTSLGGLSEQLISGCEALCADPTDPRAFAAALRQGLVDPKIAFELSRQGAARVRETYTWQAIAREQARQLRIVTRTYQGGSTERSSRRALSGSVEGI